MILGQKMEVRAKLEKFYAPKKALFIGAGQKRQKRHYFSGSSDKKKHFFIWTFFGWKYKRCVLVDP